MDDQQLVGRQLREQAFPDDRTGDLHDFAGSHPLSRTLVDSSSSAYCHVQEGVDADGATVNANGANDEINVWHRIMMMKLVAGNLAAAGDGWSSQWIRPARTVLEVLYDDQLHIP